VDLRASGGDCRASPLLLEVVAGRAMHIFFISFVPSKRLSVLFFFHARFTRIFHLWSDDFTGEVCYVAL
jgi:hypothetical protein